MLTKFPTNQNHRPKYYVINAEGKTLGRVATKVATLLLGKTTAFYTPWVNQGNYVTILNSEKIVVSGKKETQKFYYRNSQRPGSLKKETFQDLKKRLPSRILEKAIWGMLPKGVLGRKYYQRLYVFAAGPLLEVCQNKGDQSWLSVDV
jgi:large subunit ribosomal protein L13